jgi:pyruvate decarboxylase
METALVGNPVNGAAKLTCNGVGALPSANSHAVIASPAPSAAAPACATLGRHLARRLVEVGATDVFAVPGDFNLTLLDYLIAEPGLSLVGCCNELNAGYAADGYARAKGVGACAVTFTVGGLSVLNAIAGAYSENLPVICIVGGPNSNDYGTNRILHHTIGLPDFSQELRCFQTITCHQVRAPRRPRLLCFLNCVGIHFVERLCVLLFGIANPLCMQAVVNNLEDAHGQIDTAIATAFRESKPVYISVSCNLAGLTHPTFSSDPVPMFIAPRY